MADEVDSDILFELRGSAGLVTLNRPRALNALTLTMVRAMHARLLAWEADPAVTRIVVRGAGGRAFCAGGDIRRIHDLGRAGRLDEVMAFWGAEYALDAAVRRLTTPYVALIEGIVMGGGVGISVHGSHRVAAESYRFAMPETGIGFFPDVGMSFTLPRLPGRTGTYLALTGDQIGAGDALHVGLATHAAGAAEFDGIVEALADGGDVDAVLARHASAPAPGVLAEERGTIDACFAAPSVREILGRLDVAASAGSGFAAQTASLLRSRSPTSLCIAHEQMRRGRDMSFADALRTEYRLCSRVMRGHDFYEGVRAVIVEKDGEPAWRPAALDAIDPGAIEAAFAPLDGPEPDFG